MALIRPRLTDYYGILAPQANLDFAIPFFDEDVPLYVDPFLLWRSPSQQDQTLHTGLINAFNHLGYLAKRGEENQAIDNLIAASECDEVGLGSSAKRRGKRIGRDKAQEILNLFKRSPQYFQSGFHHFEEIQFFVDGVSRDEISDITCSFLKSFLIDFTIDQCEKLGIPTQASSVPSVYNYRKNKFELQINLPLPVNPVDGKPLILVPKRWLKFVPWLNYEEYFEKYCPQDDISHKPEELTKVAVLNLNREHFGTIDYYIKAKERTSADCHNDPLFSQIPVLSARRKLQTVLRLPPGKTNDADKEYEEAIGQLLPSLFYPDLDFSQNSGENRSRREHKRLNLL